MLKIFWDMDGVLCNFDETYPLLTGHTFAHDGTLTEEEKDQKWKLLDDHPEFFLNLPWISGAKQMVETVRDWVGEENSGIISAASKRISQCKDQKVAWLERELSWIPKENINIVSRKRDKVLHVIPNAILVDDYAANIKHWREYGGIGILFQNPLQTTMEIYQILTHAPSKGEISC